MQNKEIDEAKERLKYINMAYDCYNYYSRYDLDCIETLLQYIDQLENKVKEYEKQLDLDYVEENYVTKQAIREKIAELWIKCPKNSINDFMINERNNKLEVLQELLEEK